MRSTFMFRLPHTRAPFDAVDQDNFCKIWTRRRRRRAERWTRSCKLDDAACADGAGLMGCEEPAYRWGARVQIGGVAGGRWRGGRCGLFRSRLTQKSKADMVCVILTHGGRDGGSRRARKGEMSLIRTLQLYKPHPHASCPGQRACSPIFWRLSHDSNTNIIYYNIIKFCWRNSQPDVCGGGGESGGQEGGTGEKSGRGEEGGGGGAASGGRAGGRGDEGGRRAGRSPNPSDALAKKLDSKFNLTDGARSSSMSASSSVEDIDLERELQEMRRRLAEDGRSMAACARLPVRRSVQFRAADVGCGVGGHGPDACTTGPTRHGLMVTSAARDVLLGKAQPFWVPELMDPVFLSATAQLLTSCCSAAYEAVWRCFFSK